jgi:hypothetical protein
MPLLVHAVVGAFAVHGEAMQLAAQAYSEVTDIDHLLHFSQAFLVALAHLVAHQLAQCRLVHAQFLTQLAHHFAALRGRPSAPFGERTLGAGDGLFVLGLAGSAHHTDQAAIHGAVAFQAFSFAFQPGASRAHAAVLRQETEFAEG